MSTGGEDNARDAPKELQRVSGEADQRRDLAGDSGAVTLSLIRAKTVLVSSVTSLEKIGKQGSELAGSVSLKNLEFWNIRSRHRSEAPKPKGT
jgi:hypothetical protein